MAPGETPGDRCQEPATAGRRRDSPVARPSQGWPRRTRPPAPPAESGSPRSAIRRVKPAGGGNPPLPLFRVIPAQGARAWAPCQRRGLSETQAGTSRNPESSQADQAGPNRPRRSSAPARNQANHPCRPPARASPEHPSLCICFVIDLKPGPADRRVHARLHASQPHGAMRETYK